MALGSVLGVMLPDLRSINSAISLFALPAVSICGAYATVKSLVWPLFLLSYLSPIRFAF